MIVFDKLLKKDAEKIIASVEEAVGKAKVDFYKVPGVREIFHNYDVDNIISTMKDSLGRKDVQMWEEAVLEARQFLVEYSNIIYSEIASIDKSERTGSED